MNEKYAEQSETKFLLNNQIVSAKRVVFTWSRGEGDHAPIGPSSRSTPHSIQSKGTKKD